MSSSEQHSSGGARGRTARSSAWASSRRLLAGGQVRLAAGAVEAVHAALALLGRGRADPLAEGDPRAAEHVPQAVQLVVGQGVHRVDEDRRQALVDALVPLPQQVVDDRVEERFGLARARCRWRPGRAALP